MWQTPWRCWQPTSCKPAARCSRQTLRPGSEGCATADVATLEAAAWICHTTLHPNARSAVAATPYVSRESKYPAVDLCSCMCGKRGHMRREKDLGVGARKARCGDSLSVLFQRPGRGNHGIVAPAASVAGLGAARAGSPAQRGPRGESNRNPVQGTQRPVEDRESRGGLPVA